MTTSRSRALAASLAISILANAQNAFPAADPACEVASITQANSQIQTGSLTPSGDFGAFTAPGRNGFHQLYAQHVGAEPTCISCTPMWNAPWVERNKLFVNLHPSGQWMVVGAEQEWGDYWWVYILPEPLRTTARSWLLGFLECGIYLNMWITNRTGTWWRKLTEFSSRTPGKSNGFVGPAFTPDGKTAVWAEAINAGNLWEDSFGVWKLFAADSGVAADGLPTLLNKRDITPQGTNWWEPGNFSPDGRRLVLTTDLGLSGPGAEQGQDQWTLDIVTGEMKQLTFTPTVWDEHGRFSPDGKKIVWMSSSAYPDHSQLLGLWTEFFIMNADGSGVQQLTHFNEFGYPETQTKPGNPHELAGTVAAVAGFLPNGDLFTTVMKPGFGKTNWIIRFKGPCGMHLPAGPAVHGLRVHDGHGLPLSRVQG